MTVIDQPQIPGSLVDITNSIERVLPQQQDGFESKQQDCNEKTDLKEILDCNGEQSLQELNPKTKEDLLLTMRTDGGQRVLHPAHCNKPSANYYLCAHSMRWPVLLASLLQPFWFRPPERPSSTSFETSLAPNPPSSTFPKLTKNVP
eukprot:3502871-Amphidinium_carterae.1